MERERFCSPDLREFRERRSQGPARSRASRECPLRAFPVRRLPASLEPFRRRLWRLTGRQNRGKSRIVYVVQTVCLLFLFRFGMQLQVNGAWIAYAGEEYKYIDWFSTADSLFIFLFPILLSAADLL